MITTCKSRSRVIKELLVLALLLVACGPPADEEKLRLPGLDAVSQTGDWMSVLQPVQDSPSPQLIVVNMHTGQSQLVLANADIDLEPTVHFSPTDDYLLYRGGYVWRLVNIASQDEWEIAPGGMDVEFLPDGEILVTSEETVTSEDGTQSETRYRIILISPESPENRDEKFNNIRYIFLSKDIHLPAYPSLRLLSRPEFPSQTSCLPPSESAKEARVYVNAEGDVGIMTTDSRGPLIVYRPQKLSTRITGLINEQEALQRGQIKISNESTTETAQGETPAPVYIDLSGGIAGIASPDGQHLLVLTAQLLNLDDGIKRYSLYVIDLQKDKRTELSSNMEWPPTFLFSPDGSQIIFESDDDGERAWYIASSDGSGIAPLNLQDVDTLCWY